MGSKGKKTLNLLTEIYGENALEKIDKFDSAIIGIEVESKRLIYSVKKCVNVLKTEMSEEDAIDYFYTEIYSENQNFKKAIFCEDYLIKNQ